jgi:hypothetical protein
MAAVILSDSNGVTRSLSMRLSSQDKSGGADQPGVQRTSAGARLAPKGGFAPHYLPGRIWRFIGTGPASPSHGKLPSPDPTQEDGPPSRVLEVAGLASSIGADARSVGIGTRTPGIAYPNRLFPGTFSRGHPLHAATRQRPAGLMGTERQGAGIA